MKRVSISITLFSVLVGALAANATAAERRSMPQEESRHVTGREALEARMAAAATTDSLVVEFEDEASRAEVRDAVDDVEGEVVDNLSELGRVKVVEVEPGNADEAVEELAADPAVEIAEPDLPRIPLYEPTDPQFPKQWGLHNDAQKHPITDPFGTFKTIAGMGDRDIDAPQAWDIEDGSSNETIIAVLDAGFDITHPDISNNRWENPFETGPDAEKGVDDDNNGFVDDIKGWDFTGDGDSNPSDPPNGADRGHGTHVAAIAAGVTNNAKGVAGVCPNCKILPLRFGLRLREELKAINYVIGLIDKHPALNIRVLNASFGSPFWSALERRAFAKLGKRGVLTVAAAGNGGLDNDMWDAIDFQNDGTPDDFSPLYPASYELARVISVAASNDKDQFGYFTGCDKRAPRYRCLFSNWGRDSVDVAAPGTDIRSAYVTKNGVPQYRTWNGTSMSAPFVSGIAGLVAAEHPGAGATGIKNAIMSSVDKPDSLQKLWRRPGGPDRGSFIRSNGRVNALSALTGDTGDAAPVSDGTIGGAKGMGDFRKGRVAWPGDVNDIYRKWLHDDVRYVATLHANRRARNIQLVINKPGTKDVWQFEDACAGGRGKCHVVKPFLGFSDDGVERIEFTAHSEGTYYFHVSSYFVDTGYRLRVHKAN